MEPGGTGGRLISGMELLNWGRTAMVPLAQGISVATLILAKAIPGTMTRKSAPSPLSGGGRESNPPTDSRRRTSFEGWRVFGHEWVAREYGLPGQNAPWPSQWVPTDWPGFAVSREQIPEQTGPNGG